MDFSDPISTVVPSVRGRVLLVIGRSGLELTGRRIAELAETSAERTRQILGDMMQSGLVRSRRAGQAILYEANRDHLLWPAVQRLVEDSDQAVWALKQRVAGALVKTIGADAAKGTTAALFGSVARGDSRPGSDVDVLLITPDDLDESRAEDVVVSVIREVESATGNDCNVFHVTRARFDALARENDPMIASWSSDAAIFNGPDFRRRLKGARWDELAKPPRAGSANGPPRPASTFK